MLPIALSLIFIQLVQIHSEEMANIKPKVLVFDLDYTLWPFWVDTHVYPPFQKKSDGSVIDSRGYTVTYYPEVPKVLNDLHSQGYILAVASRTPEIEAARLLVDLLDWKKLFSNQQIFPGRKTQHITNIKNAFGVEFSDIIFFDDEKRNINDVTDLGVFSVLVSNGVTKKVVEDALSQYSRQRST